MAGKPRTGEFWAYRVGRKLGKEVTRVEVVEPPEQRRVIIRHVDSGDMEEVPLQRLVVPWEEAGKFIDDERKLQAVYAPRGARGALPFAL